MAKSRVFLQQRPLCVLIGSFSGPILVPLESNCATGTCRKMEDIVAQGSDITSRDLDGLAKVCVAQNKSIF